MASCIHRASVVGRALRVTAILSVALSVAMSTAQAAELQVPVSIALRGPVAEVAAAFEKRSGHTVKMTLAAPGEIVAASPFISRDHRGLEQNPAHLPEPAARDRPRADGGGNRR